MKVIMILMLVIQNKYDSMSLQIYTFDITTCIEHQKIINKIDPIINDVKISLPLSYSFKPLFNTTDGLKKYENNNPIAKNITNKQNKTKMLLFQYDNL